jgi:DNA-binding transcriptional LysR family regulator
VYLYLSEIPLACGPPPPELSFLNRPVLGFDSSTMRSRPRGAAGRGVIGHLHIGILSSMAAGFLREAIGTFHAGHADVALHILEGASREQIALVRENRLDVAFVLGAPDWPNCNVTQLWTEHIFAALPQGHVLCDCDEITWECFRYEKVILCQFELGGAIHDRLITRFAELGYSPWVERLDVGREALMYPSGKGRLAERLGV